MAELDDVYNTKILELAGNIPRSMRLTAPSATASAQSKLCGSTITVDVVLEDGRIADYGQTVKACLLGQAAASVVGREIIGTTPAEFHAIADQMRMMLKDGGPAPSGRWADLAVLAPVRDYRSRHASTLLVFDAVERAFEMSKDASTKGNA
jgi:NifU-like protein involved in Fe-S cluster formation